MLYSLLLGDPPASGFYVPKRRHLNSDAGETPKRKDITYTKRRKFEINNLFHNSYKHALLSLGPLSQCIAILVGVYMMNNDHALPDKIMKRTEWGGGTRGIFIGPTPVISCKSKGRFIFLL
jgi:hypothetical protein